MVLSTTIKEDDLFSLKNDVSGNHILTLEVIVNT